jgi:hypothetical protein
VELPDGPSESPSETATQKQAPSDLLKPPRVLGRINHGETP